MSKCIQNYNLDNIKRKYNDWLNCAPEEKQRYYDRWSDYCKSIVNTSYKEVKKICIANNCLCIGKKDNISNHPEMTEEQWRNHLRLKVNRQIVERNKIKLANKEFKDEYYKQRNQENIIRMEKIISVCSNYNDLTKYVKVYLLQKVKSRFHNIVKDRFKITYGQMNRKIVKIKRRQRMMERMEKRKLLKPVKLKVEKPKKTALIKPVKLKVEKPKKTALIKPVKLKVENDEKNCTTIEVKNSKYDNDYKYKKPLGRPKTIIEVDSTPFWEQIEKVEKNKKVILINRDVLYGNDELYKERLLPLDEDVLEKRIQNFCIPLTKKNAYSYFISDNVNEFYENRVLECYNLKQQCFTMSQRERLENALLLIKEALESQKFASDIEIHQKAVANAKSKRKLVEDMTQEEYLDFCDERDKYKNNEDIDDFGDILP